MSTYDKAMADSRILNWRHVDDVRPIVGQVVIGARRKGKGNDWVIARIRWCEECEHYTRHQPNLGIHQHPNKPWPATHIAKDTLGTPTDA